MQSMWRLLSAAALATACLSAVAGDARAEASISGNVALTSDYVFRGISQTDMTLHRQAADAQRQAAGERREPGFGR